MSDHDDVVRASFSRQVGLFSGPDSPFVRRPAGTVEQLEPLDDGHARARRRAAALRTRPRWWHRACGRSWASTSRRPARARRGPPGRGRRAATCCCRKGNAQALPFVAGSFDLVYCFASLHHVGDPATAVAEMARVRGTRWAGRAAGPHRARSRGARPLRRRAPSRRPVAPARATSKPSSSTLLPDGAELTYAATTDVPASRSRSRTPSSPTSRAAEAALRGRARRRSR